MKITINQSAKKVISFCLALAVLVGSLFVTNVGADIKADAQATEKVYDYWSNSDSASGDWYDTSFAGSGTETDPYLITSCEELAAVCCNKVTTSGKYFKVSGVDEFFMDSAANVEKHRAITSPAETQTFYEDGTSHARIWWQSSGAFEGNIDFAGATVYGVYTSAGYQGVFGLFHQIKSCTIKNLNVRNFYSSTDDSDKSSSFSGAIFGQGTWGSDYTANIENCTIENCYIKSTGVTQVGIIGGHAGNVTTNIKNCFINNNTISETSSQNNKVIGYGDKGSTVTDCLFAGEQYICSTKTACVYTDVYTTQSQSLTGVTTLSVKAMSGPVAQINMSGLDWVTDTQDGFWYASETGLPSVKKPDNWTYIAPPDIWDGTKADSFAGGSGTEDDPYIIETPEQLYKMVQDGGREQTGTKTLGHIYANTFTKVDGAYVYEDRYNVTVPVYRKCYYKVADGVTEIYLNAVDTESPLTSIKELVAAGTAENWTKDFVASSYMTDADKDGFRDQSTAFRGEFDGNGATIYGLYSTAGSRAWNIEGVGFVPALMEDAVIKNVVFDGSYVYNKNYAMAAVITTSLGIDADDVVTDYDIDAAQDGGQKNSGIASVLASIGIHNVTVRNAYVGAKQSGYNNADVAGFVATYGYPRAISFTNCLFDGTTCEFVVAGTTPAYKAGIISAQSTTDHIYLENCVSIGEYPVPAANTKCKLRDCYTTVEAKHDGLTGNITEFNQTTMPALNWTQWSAKDGKLAVTGISTAYDHSFNWDEAIANCNEARWSLAYAATTMGNWTMPGAYEDGVYINYEDMLGSGTKDDPYLISDALTLARVIGSGGTRYTEKLYFKLTNDISVGGLRWISTDEYIIDSDGNGTLDQIKYSYRPFAGEIDGDGYAVTDLFACDDAANETGVGLIPVLAGGKVQNLHVRGAYISGYRAGAVVGEIDPEYGGVVTGCSVEDSTVISEDDQDQLRFVGYHDDIIDTDLGLIEDSYFIGEDATVYVTEHIMDEGVVKLSADQLKDLITTDATYKETWYIGGADNKMPKLVNRAKAMPCVDIDGDGEGYEYAPSDLTALKNKLLKKKAYANVCGDVTRNGIVNSSDLVALVRAINSDYNHAKDGFWRNVSEGNLAIYYGENDNYDAARKLELYLEAEVPGVDIIKNASGTNTFVHTNDGTATPSAQFAIVVGNAGSYSTALTDNDYGITYDNDNAVLWIQGANFTGVEQAVLDFIANSSAANGTVYTVDTATLSEEKQPRTVGGTTYYYAWGDEFDVTTSDNSVQKEVWEYSEMGSETSAGATSKYMNMETADPTDLANLYEVKDGKLSIWRGLNSTVYKETQHAWGYKPVAMTNGSTTVWGATIESDDKFATAGKITTERSMLFKQGYVEMKASLPNDGHSFPAWWLFGAPNGGQNRTYTASLFSKIYELNPNWTGANAMNGAYPNSYKYQIPTAHLEFDIVELMQDISYAEEDNDWLDNWLGTGVQKETVLTGIDRTAVNLTVHKWYNENVDNGTLYIIDWDKWLSDRTAPTTYTLTDNGGKFDTSVSNGQFITRWDGMLNYDFGTLSKLAEEHVYGFKWVANETNNTFTVTLYVDGTQRLTFNQSKSYYESAEKAGGTYVKDGEVFNQYVYFLLDNHFYSANQHYKDGTEEYTDLLTQESGDKATFDIDYVRVYQEDGKRDIVTKETEAFNNGNHFGYGE